MMSKYRIYDKVVPKKWIYNRTQIIIAEIDWDYSHEFSDAKLYPDDWDGLRALGYHDHSDAAIHLWVEKYHPDMHKWLTSRGIKWQGTQSGDSAPTKNGIRGFSVICVTLANVEHITEFVLTWG